MLDVMLWEQGGDLPQAQLCGSALPSVLTDLAFTVPSNTEKRRNNPAWLEVDEQLRGDELGWGQQALGAQGRRPKHPLGLARGLIKINKASHSQSAHFQLRSAKCLLATWK